MRREFLDLVSESMDTLQSEGLPSPDDEEENPHTLLEMHIPKPPPAIFYLKAQDKNCVMNSEKMDDLFKELVRCKDPLRIVSVWVQLKHLSLYLVCLFRSHARIEKKLLENTRLIITDLEKEEVVGFGKQSYKENS